MIPPVTVPIPEDWVLSSNHRLHWRRKSERTKWVRDAAHIYAIQVHQGRRLLTRQRCIVTVQRGTSRFRDVANLTPTVKAAIDGIVGDAGLLPDDSDRWLVGPDLRVADERCANAYAFSLTFTFEDAR